MTKMDFNTLGKQVADLHDNVSLTRDELDKIRTAVAEEQNRMVAQINASMTALVASLTAAIDNLDKITNRE